MPVPLHDHLARVPGGGLRLLRDALLAVLHQGIHEHARLIFLDLAELLRGAVPQRRLQGFAQDLKPCLSRCAGLCDTRAHLPRGPVLHEGDAESVEDNVMGDMRYRAVGVVAAPLQVGEQLIRSLCGVEEDDDLASESYVEDLPVLGSPFPYPQAERC